MSDTLFDIDQWEDIPLADVKPGDWVWQIGFTGCWTQIKSITAHPNGRIEYALVRPRGADSFCMGGMVKNRPVRVYMGTPPEAERAR